MKDDLAAAAGLIAAAIAAFFGHWLTRRGKSEEVKVDAQGVLNEGLLGAIDDFREEVGDLRRQVDAMHAEVNTLHRELGRAHLVIELLSVQLRSLGVEPELPPHLSDVTNNN